MPTLCSAEMARTLREAEAAEVFGLGLHGFGVHLVDGEEDGLAAAEEEAGEFEVGGGELGAAVDDHDDGVGFGEGGLGLAEDFGGDEGDVVGDDAAGVDDAGVAPDPLDLAVDAVAGDAGLVADDGAAGAGEAIEEGGLADVGAAADGDEWEVAGGGGIDGEVELGGEEFGGAPGAEFGGGVGVGFGAADVGGVGGLAAYDAVGGSCCGAELDGVRPGSLRRGRWSCGILFPGSGWGCASSFRARRAWWRGSCACAGRRRRWWA